MAAHESLNGELFPETRGTTASKTEWSDTSKEMRPTGNLPYQRTLSWRDVPTFPGAKDTQRIKPEVGEWRRKPNNTPMQMFHSAREIMTGWRAHEGDRRFVDSTVSAGGKRGFGVETDTQMWDRKLSEASNKGYAQVHQYGSTLVEHLSSGGDMSPIPLSHLPNPVDKDTDPRPMVAGGQHRIASMMHLNPDQLLPVEHHESILHAKATKGYT